ncbi:BTAD domain-containing putative transcriptional regulator [Lentzea sp. DG1S-22]|uniref:AfsR/SARP family transcriptional regulator n=1 Tax=Lentzea sp. DG1S-22 TaxID=3108822 RepID=UPI002E75F3CC|nr:BTAD domain-containing putative transcriptional regulator [Lentzea sp. DG1S-22]WVH79488.1 BTAD domain-containing putative transcriptional regulator [Lentzea sp. DG1S-22]
MSVEFRVLGPLEVLLDGEPVPVPAGRGRVLLAALLLRPNQFVPVDELVHRLWDGAPPSAGRAHKTLQTTVLRLRQALGAANRIRTAAGGYVAEVRPEELDLLRFRDLVPAGDFATALRLWRGPALTDVRSDSLHRDEVPRLEEERLSALERRIDADLDRGLAAELVAELDVLVGQHPLRERFRAQKMTALARCGRQAEAVESYREIAALLADELGVDPSPELRRLHAALLGGATGVPRREVVRQLPPDTTGLVGRARLLDRISAELTAPGVPVVVLTGAPGVGKSALAVKAAHRLSGRFPDGQLFVRLNGAGGVPRSPSEVLAEFLVALGVPRGGIPDGAEARGATFRARLADRAVLVVLDDAAGPEQVRPLLPGTAGCAVLISSRHQLVQVEGARSVRVPPLDAGDGEELLATLLGPGADPSAVRAIAGACGGLPLALKVAGARLTALGSSPASLARRLSDERHRLDELTSGELEVRATFGPSYEALPADAARAFRRLGLLGATDVASWTAGVLAGGDGERLVERLVEANLLDEVGLDAAGEPRYRLHDLLAVYAAELAADEGGEVVTAALRDYVGLLLTLVDLASERWSAGDAMPPRPFEASTALERSEVERLAGDGERFLLAEKVNIERVITLCLRENWVGEASGLMDRAFHYLDVHYSHDRVVQLRELVRDAASAAGDELVAWRSQADLLHHRITRGITGELLAGLSRCADAFAEINAHAELAQVLGALTYFTTVRTGEPQVELAERAVEAARASGVRNLFVSNLRELGSALSDAGRHAESVRVLDEALAISRETGTRSEIALVLSRIGTSALAGGDLGRAHAAIEEALAFAVESDEVRGVAYCTAHLAQVDLALGDADTALARAGEALELFDQLGESRGAVRALAVAAEASLVLGRHAEVIDLATAALENHADAGDAGAEERLRAALEEARGRA